jgi:hypothetical protein
VFGELVGAFLADVAFLAVPAYFVLQPVAVIRLKGRWKVAALAPLSLAIPAVLRSLYALSQDSNLWPLVFVLFAPLGTLYLAVLLSMAAIMKTAGAQ